MMVMVAVVVVVAVAAAPVARNVTVLTATVWDVDDEKTRTMMSKQKMMVAMLSRGSGRYGRDGPWRLRR